MKKTYPVSTKARAVAGWHKHLRPAEKRRVNKSTRKLGKLNISQRGYPKHDVLPFYFDK